MALISAFALLGTRGVWEPDEGRYTNVALNMLDSGDWIEPHRSHEVGHWTKPPLFYWAVAASIAVFGHNSWATRLPGALSFLLCTWLAWRLARRLAPGAELQAALVYATMLLPMGASQFITTDFLLSACLGIAALGFVEARFVTASKKRWLVLMWLGIALGFMTKGPPALIILLPFLAFDLLSPGRQKPAMFLPAGLLVFVLVALPWYLAVVSTTPGLLQYFLGQEVVDRFATAEFRRHGEWYGWVEIYLPTLLLGTFPWTMSLLRWTRELPKSVRRWRGRESRATDAPAMLLALWVLVPLAIFCVARSRMPLYILPLFLPLAIIAARQRHAEGRGLPRWHWLALWAIVLIALKLAGAYWPTHKDDSRWAEAIRMRTSGVSVGDVVFVDDMARYGLRLYTGTGVEKVSLADSTQRRFNPVYDASLANKLADHDADSIWICKHDRWPEIRAHLEAAGWTVRTLEPRFEGRVFFRVLPKVPDRMTEPITYP